MTISAKVSREYNLGCYTGTISGLSGECGCLHRDHIIGLLKQTYIFHFKLLAIEAAIEYIGKVGTGNSWSSQSLYQALNSKKLNLIASNIGGGMGVTSAWSPLSNFIEDIWYSSDEEFMMITDSLSSLQALKSQKLNNLIVSNILLMCHYLSGNKDIVFCWVPGDI